MVLPPTDLFSDRIQSRLLAGRRMVVTLGNLFPTRGQPLLLCPVTGQGKTLRYLFEELNSRKDGQRRNFCLHLGEPLSWAKSLQVHPLASGNLLISDVKLQNSHFIFLLTLVSWRLLTSTLKPGKHSPGLCRFKYLKAFEGRKGEGVGRGGKLCMQAHGAF